MLNYFWLGPFLQDPEQPPHHHRHRNGLRLHVAHLLGQLRLGDFPPNQGGLLVADLETGPCQGLDPG
jgi:hypothetical protein